MVSLVPIPFVGLRTEIRIAFEEDAELIEKYHVVNGSLLNCVDDTMNRIKAVAATDDLRCYVVENKGVPIGFTVIGQSFLLSFGINIRYRTKAILMEWWGKVCHMLNNEFVTWIFKKNTRTINFLKRNGMEVIADDNNDYFNLIYLSCQQEVPSFQESSD